MKQILADSSTVMLVSRLLSGEERPSAINVFDLSILVESVILHETILVLNTTQRRSSSEQQLENAAATWGGAIELRNHTPQEVLNDYVAKHQSEDTSSGEPVQYWDGEKTRGFLGVINHLDEDLFKSYDDDEEFAQYSQLLTEIYEGHWQSRHTPRHDGLAVRAARKVLGLGPDNVTSHNPLESFKTGDEIHRHYQRLYDKTNLPGKSPWEYQMTMDSMSYRHFAKGVILRAHLYLIASEVFAAPYKADSLRWPICWKFFNAGSLDDLCKEERFVDAAEEFEARRIESANEFFSQRVFLARLPLFLRWIMKECKTPSDIVALTLKIRTSKEAQRFREYASQVRLDIEDGKIKEVLSGVTQYSRLLSQQYGIDKTEVAWTLLSEGAKVATGGINPRTAVDLAKSGTRIGGGLLDMWRNRKFALISKAINQGREARSFEHDLKRLFGSGLSAAELNLLERLNSFGTSSG